MASRYTAAQVEGMSLEELKQLCLKEEIVLKGVERSERAEHVVAELKRRGMLEDKLEESAVAVAVDKVEEESAVAGVMESWRL